MLAAKFPIPVGRGYILAILKESELGRRVDAFLIFPAGDLVAKRNERKAATFKTNSAF